MTIVEFFDKNATENIASALLCNPDRIVFIGYNANKMHRAIESYSDVLKERGINCKLEIKSVNRNDLFKITEVLSEVFKSDEDCHFDLEGGEELYLVAVGIMAAKYGQKVGLHKYNVSSGSFIDCDEDGNPSHEKEVKLTVKENIKIYLGSTVKSKKCAESGEDVSDLKKLWEIMCVNASMYNVQINALGLASKHYLDVGSLYLSLNLENAKAVLEKEGEKFVYVPQIFSSLSDKGLILDLKEDGDKLSFRYKSEYVRFLLSKAGNCLEQYIAYIASTCQSDSGEKVYNDILTSVVIDWDGEQIKGQIDVENEIDVMLMHNMVPVFISCKNGSVDSDELYKIASVAERFGGKYAKKALVVSELEKMGSLAQYIKARADEMGIKLIDNAASSSEDELRKTIKAFWN